MRISSFHAFGGAMWDNLAAPDRRTAGYVKGRFS